mmetsp:Transcript_13997/g.40268  ORF Transcript_13997/g.40268 Transcript_13997/m.40268 type:complete len:243 (-) Transcript_13997:243-971(-)
MPYSWTSMRTVTLFWASRTCARTSATTSATAGPRSRPSIATTRLAERECPLRHGRNTSRSSTHTAFAIVLGVHLFVNPVALAGYLVSTSTWRIAKVVMFGYATEQPSSSSTASGTAAFWLPLAHHPRSSGIVLTVRSGWRPGSSGHVIARIAPSTCTATRSRSSRAPGSSLSPLMRRRTPALPSTSRRPSSTLRGISGAPFTTFPARSATQTGESSRWTSARCSGWLSTVDRTCCLIARRPH